MPRPEVPEHLMWVWRAYQRLSSDRPWISGGLGGAIPGAIPWTALVEWVRYHRYGEPEMAMLDYCFREMDAVYIQHYHRKTEKQAR